MTELVRMERLENRALATGLDPKAVESALGYSVAARMAERESCEARLFQVCVDAGIRPFQTAAVEAYKEAATTTRVGLYVGSGVLAISMAIGAAFFFSTGDIGIPITAGIFGIIAFGFFKSLGDFPIQFHWETERLEGYRQQVPIGVLEIAMQLKAKDPGVTFQVHSLVMQQDPFLSVHLGEAMFYVARWDEPRFEAKYE